MTHYAEYWNDLRRRERWLLFFLIAYIPVVGGLVMLLERFVSPDVPGVALAIAWMLMLLVAWYRFLSFACPRCGERFHTKWFGWVSAGRRCVHCSLERGA
jgi:hypothetical protein